MRTGPRVLGHSCGADARAHQGRVTDVSPHKMESERTAGNLFRAEVPLEAKPSSDDVRVEASPKHDDSHVPQVELSDEASKAIKDEVKALQLNEDKWLPASSSQMDVFNKLVYLANRRHPDLTLRRAAYGVRTFPALDFSQHVKGITMFEDWFLKQNGGFGGKVYNHPNSSITNGKSIEIHSSKALNVE